MSDSFDIFEACEKIWGETLRRQVLGRDGCVVIRPDSGDPPTVLASGRPSVLEILAEKFGYTINAKGYKVLDPHVRVIQGDAVDFAMLDAILYAMQKAGFSADNIAFGSGGGLLQKLNRDTLEFAFKCAAVVVDGRERDVFKSPVTDRGKQLEERADETGAGRGGRMGHLPHRQSRGARRGPAGRGLPRRSSCAIGRSPRFASVPRRGFDNMRAKAIVFPNPLQAVIDEVEIPPLGEQDVLVEVEYSSISVGTERWCLTGRLVVPGQPPLAFPHVPGYQAAGVVAGKPASGSKASHRETGLQPQLPRSC